LQSIQGEDFESVVSRCSRSQLSSRGEEEGFGIKFAPSMDRAKEMFEGIVNARRSAMGALAQFNIGRRSNAGKYGEAIASYISVVARYLNDPSRSMRNTIAMSVAEFREAATSGWRRKAREEFEDFIIAIPDAKSAQARET